MEYKRRFSRRWFQKFVNYLIFGVFTANAQAQIFGPPSFVVQPLGISVQNGGTALLTTSAASVPLPITSVTWYYNDKAISAGNASIVTVNLGVSATSVLTITNFSSANAGNYKVKIANASGSVSSSNVVVIALGNVVPAVVNLVSSGTGMIKEGFKLQISAPIGSNVVIEATSDLSNWSPIATNNATTGSVTYTDTVAKVVSCRFYRAKLQ
jgi:hypothetical protein